MKKILYVGVILLMTISMLFGATVESDVAQLVAENWYVEKSGCDSNDISIASVISKSENSETLCYIFNFVNGGFVIVAGDDASIPVLGYDVKRNYVEKNCPPQLKAMMSNFKEQMLHIKSNNFTANTETKNEWQRLNVSTQEFKATYSRGYVEPLLTTTWNQGWPWNSYCPDDSDGDNGHVYAGCVAVSMAQVMNYWEHPIKGTGSHEYYHEDYGYLNANFGSTTYDWENMADDSSTSATEELLYHCGVAVEMKYGPYGSGAYMFYDDHPCALYALVHYFGYDDSAVGKCRYDYLDSEWDNIIKAELDAERPLVYGGQGEAGGHAFNVDGYDGSYFHVNWGWSGNGDGYFYLSNLNPGSYTFTESQVALFNVYPKELEDGNIVGSVIDVETQKMVGGATVTIGEQTIYSDSEGNFSISIVPGEYTLTCSADGYEVASDSVSVSSCEEVCVDFQLKPIHTLITGIVTDKKTDEPIAGAKITTSEYEVVTDIEGHYSLEVEAGTYNLNCIAEGYQEAIKEGVYVELGTTVSSNFKLELKDGSPTILAIEDVPNDQGSYVHITFSKSYWDQEGLDEKSRSTASYTVWEEYKKDEWVAITSLGALAQDTYTIKVGTYADSTENNPNKINFRISANMEKGTWMSEIADGYSVDNLAPSTPKGLKFVSGILSWDVCSDKDFQYFKVYFSETSGRYNESFATTIDTVLVDEINEGYYVLTSIDFAGNESTFSNEVQVNLSGINEENIISSVTALGNNYPNPFNPSTTIAFSVKDGETGTLAIYNAKGQVIESNHFEAGTHFYHWDGTGFGSGVYFYKLETNKDSQIKKMIMLK